MAPNQNLTTPWARGIAILTGWRRAEVNRMITGPACLNRDQAESTVPLVAEVAAMLRPESPEHFLHGQRADGTWICCCGDHLEVRAIEESTEMSHDGGIETTFSDQDLADSLEGIARIFESERPKAVDDPARVRGWPVKVNMDHIRTMAETAKRVRQRVDLDALAEEIAARPRRSEP